MGIQAADTAGWRLKQYSILSAAVRLCLVSTIWFTRFWIVIPTVSLSLRFCSACRKRSSTLARKWVTGSLALEGGNRRTTSCVPMALNRLYRRVIVSSISNLRAMVIVCKRWKICAVTHWKNYLRYKVLTITPLIWLLLTDVSPLYKYLHYAPLILPSGIYDSNWYRRAGLPPFILRLITSCLQKRAYYNYLHVATVAICFFYFSSLCYW